MTTPSEEKELLNKAFDEFANYCKARLFEMADRGKHGWDDPQWDEYIAEDMRKYADRASVLGDRRHLHDIANRAMMLWWQDRNNPHGRRET